MGFRVGDHVGDYRIVAPLGSGGAGEVFRVRHSVTGRVEAMKVLLRSRTGGEESAERFEREIKLQAKLDHPGIASVHNAFWEGNELVMVMELVGGSSLDRLIAAEPAKLTPAMNFAMQALEALEYAHQQGVTHRDIKPENIMVTADGRVKLMDFGLAKEDRDPKLTQLGAVVGSLYYIAPEQARGNGDVDSRADIYSFGAVLYELLTGVKPFRHDNTFALLQAAVSETPPPPKQLRPEIPEALSNAVMRAMAKSPSQRFQSAEEFRAILQEIAEDPSVTVEAPAEVNAPPQVIEDPRHKRRRMMFVAAGLVAVAYLAITSISDNLGDTQDGMATASASATGPDLGGYRALHTIKLEHQVDGLSFSANGSRLVVAGEDGTTSIDGLTGRVVATVAGSQIAELGADGQLAATSNGGHTAAIREFGSLKSKRSLEHAGVIGSIAFSADGRYVATGAADNTIRAWDLRDPTRAPVFSAPKGGPRDLAFSPAAPMLAWVSDSGALTLQSLAQDTASELRSRVRRPRQLVFSPSGLELLLVGRDRAVLWDISRREAILDADATNIRDAAKHESLGWLRVELSRRRPDAVVIKSLAGGQALFEIPHASPVTALAISPAGDVIATATAGGTLTIWQPSL